MLAEGTAFTVTVADAVTPQLFVYKIDTVPADIPVTKPDAFTEATALLLLLQVPPVVAEASVVVAPAQIDVFPVIGNTMVGETDTVNVPVITLP